MTARLRASLVHLLTASGAALALLALLASAKGDWQEMFMWLGLALVVDGIDGPLVCRAHVATVLPRFNGERLDLIVDYLTYVAIPPLRWRAPIFYPRGFVCLPPSPFCCRACFMSLIVTARRRTVISSASPRFGILSASIFSLSCRQGR